MKIEVPYSFVATLVVTTLACAAGHKRVRSVRVSADGGLSEDGRVQAHLAAGAKLASQRLRLPEWIPAAPSCVLGGGFDPLVPCDALGRALAQPPPCDDGQAASQAPCASLSALQAETETSVRHVETRSDIKQLAHAFASSSGAPFGIHVSAAVEFLERISAGGLDRIKILHSEGKGRMQSYRGDSSQLKLSSGARGLLEQSPEKFVEIYGCAYISGLIFGHSFTAVMSNQSTAPSKVDTAMVRKVSIAGSSALGAAPPEGSQFQADVMMQGGEGVPGGPFDSEQGVDAAYAQWFKTRFENGIPLYFTVRSYLDISEIMEVVIAKHPEKLHLFHAAEVVQEVQDMLLQTIFALNYLRNTCGSILASSPSIKAEDAVRLQEWRDAATQQLIRASRDRPHEYAALFLDLQRKALTGDYAWFKQSDDLAENVEAKLQAAPLKGIRFMGCAVAADVFQNAPRTPIQKELEAACLQDEISQLDQGDSVYLALLAQTASMIIRGFSGSLAASDHRPAGIMENDESCKAHCKQAAQQECTARYRWCGSETSRKLQLTPNVTATKQSSLYHSKEEDWGSGRALDGQVGTRSCTKEESHPWWEVDLGSEAIRVTSVVVTCGSIDLNLEQRMFEILLDDAVVATFSDAMPEASKEVQVLSEKMGRKLRIQISSSETAQLQLAEVQVFVKAQSWAIYRRSVG